MRNRSTTATIVGVVLAAATLHSVTPAIAATKKTVKSSKSAVKVMVILDESAAANNFLDTARSGARARVKRINAAGGLGGSGRAVQLDFCVTDLDPNKALACANKAVSDKSYVAAAGGFSSATETAPLYEKAGLANIPGAAFTPGDWTSKNVFNITSAVFVVAGVGTIACKELGYKKLVEGRNNLPASIQATDLSNAALASNGCASITKSVDFAIDASDVSAQVQTLGSAGADAVVLDILPSLSEQIFPSRKQLGIKTPFVGAVAEFTNESVKNMADALEGTHVAGWMPTDDFAAPGNTAYLADFKAAGEKEGVKGDTSRSAWAALDLLDTAAKTAKTIDRAGILAALGTVNAYNAGGMTPTLDFTKPGPNPNFPRLHNLTVFHAIVKNGKFTTGSTTFIPIFGTGK